MNNHKVLVFCVALISVMKFLCGQGHQNRLFEHDCKNVMTRCRYQDNHPRLSFSNGSPADLNFAKCCISAKKNTLTELTYQYFEVNKAENIFQKLTKLKMLTLCDCLHCTYFPSDMFHGTNLVTLYIQRTNLTTIPVFHGLATLESLSLEHSLLSYLPESNFTIYPKLETVRFRDNDISNISSKSFYGTEIRSLTLSQNLLTCVPMLLGLEKSLTILNLNKNQITFCDNKYTVIFTDLSQLTLNQNKLNRLPNIIFVAPNVTVLDLQNNQFKIIHYNLSFTPRLEKLFSRFNDFLCICVLPQTRKNYIESLLIADYTAKFNTDINCCYSTQVKTASQSK